MDIITAPISEDGATIVAKPDEEQIKAMNVRSAGIVKDLFNAENEVWIGKPHFFQLQALEPTSTHSKLITPLSRDYDFLLVQLACSFRASNNCEFMQACLQVDMVNVVPGAEDPIAYEMFPAEVFMPVTYSRKLTVKPEFKVDFTKVLQVEASAFSYENAKEYIIYQPEIVSYAKGTNQPKWDFNKSSSRELRGTKDLFLIVKKVKSTSATFNISIRDLKVRTVSVGLLSLPKLFTKTTKEPVVEDKVLIVNL